MLDKVGVAVPNLASKDFPLGIWWFLLKGSCRWQQMKSSFHLLFSKFTKCLSLCAIKKIPGHESTCVTSGVIMLASFYSKSNPEAGLVGGGHLPPLLPKVSLCSKRSLAGTGEVKLPRKLFGLQLALFLQIFQGCSLQKYHQFELVFSLVYTSVWPLFNNNTFPSLKLAAELLLTWHLTRSVRDPRTNHFCRRDFGSYVLGMIINQ